MTGQLDCHARIALRPIVDHASNSTPLPSATTSWDLSVSEVAYWAPWDRGGLAVCRPFLDSLRLPVRQLSCLRRQQLSHRPGSPADSSRHRGSATLQRPMAPGEVVGRHEQCDRRLEVVPLLREARGQPFPRLSRLFPGGRSCELLPPFVCVDLTPPWAALTAFLFHPLHPRGGGSTSSPGFGRLYVASLLCPRHPRLLIGSLIDCGLVEGTLRHFSNSGAFLR
jgi:hypothetical protein